MPYGRALFGSISTNTTTIGVSRSIACLTLIDSKGVSTIHGCGNSKHILRTLPLVS